MEPTGDVVYADEESLGSDVLVIHITVSAITPSSGQLLITCNLRGANKPSTNLVSVNKSCDDIT